MQRRTRPEATGSALQEALVVALSADIV